MRRYWAPFAAVVCLLAALGVFDKFKNDSMARLSIAQLLFGPRFTEAVQLPRTIAVLHVLSERDRLYDVVTELPLRYNNRSEEQLTLLRQHNTILQSALNDMIGSHAKNTSDGTEAIDALRQLAAEYDAWTKAFDQLGHASMAKTEYKRIYYQRALDSINPYVKLDQPQSGRTADAAGEVISPAMNRSYWVPIMFQVYVYTQAMRDGIKPLSTQAREFMARLEPLFPVENERYPLPVCAPFVNTMAQVALAHSYLGEIDLGSGPPTLQSSETYLKQKLVALAYNRIAKQNAKGYETIGARCDNNFCDDMLQLVWRYSFGTTNGDATANVTRVLSVVQAHGEVMTNVFRSALQELARYYLQLESSTVSNPLHHITRAELRIAMCRIAAEKCGAQGSKEIQDSIQELIGDEARGPIALDDVVRRANQAGIEVEELKKESPMLTWALQQVADGTVLKDLFTSAKDNHVSPSP